MPSYIVIAYLYVRSLVALGCCMYIYIVLVIVGIKHYQLLMTSREYTKREYLLCTSIINCRLCIGHPSVLIDMGTSFSFGDGPMFG